MSAARSIDKRRADLVTAELMHELDGAAAADAERGFEDRAIDDGRFEAAATRR